MEDQLIVYIECVKVEVDVFVGYVDVYFLFENYLCVVVVCDVLLVNCYLFWEGYLIEYVYIYMCEMYWWVQWVVEGKKVIIVEIGWLNIGICDCGVVLFCINVMKYFIDVVEWI